ncbi:MAG: tetratricopeptide repeat protein [Gemmatimonadetes bacterium]|nr:tetratricopeptide repeat protein [Gemmatimonadota bacterium]
MIRPLVRPFRGFTGWIRELQHRRVFKVIAIYAAGAFVLLEAASIVMPALGFSDTLFRILVILTLLGAPLSVVLAWMFDITPQGVVRGTPAEEVAEPPTDMSGSGRSLNARERPGVDSQAPDSGHLAVVPFSDLGGSGTDDYLIQGITEDIIGRLAKVPHLRVIAPASVMRFKGQDPAPRKVGEALGVRHVVCGSVQEAGGRLRIRANLADTATEHTLWAESFDYEAEHLFEMESDVARQIAEALEGTLAPAVAKEVEARLTSNMRAYDAYLRGRYRWDQRTERSLERSLELFGEAVSLDPGFAHAHAGIADAHLVLAMYGARPPGEDMEKARNAALRALEIQPDLVEAKTTLACLTGQYDWNWEEAERLFLEATGSRIPYPTAFRWYALNLLMPLGRMDDAREALATNWELDPLSPVTLLSEGAVAFYSRDFEAAKDICQELVTKEPAFAVGHLFLGRVLRQLGDLPEAERVLRAAVSLSGNNAESRAALACVLGASGRNEEVDAIVSELTSGKAYVSPALLAGIEIGRGRVEEALSHLEAAVEIRATDLAWVGQRPGFDPLRAEPRFKALIERIGFCSSLWPPKGPTDQSPPEA